MMSLLGLLTEHAWRVTYRRMGDPPPADSITENSYPCMNDNCLSFLFSQLSTMPLKGSFKFLFLCSVNCIPIKNKGLMKLLSYVKHRQRPAREGVLIPILRELWKTSCRAQISPCNRVSSELFRQAQLCTRLKAPVSLNAPRWRVLLPWRWVFISGSDLKERAVFAGVIISMFVTLI